MRFYKQKGLLPTALFYIGLFIHLLFIGGTLPYFLLASVSLVSNEIASNTLISLIDLIFGMIGLVWSIPLIIGSFFVSAFPKIGLGKDGIETCTYLVFRSRIKWSEIDSILELPKGYKAITIARPGLSLINGLYSKKIFGDIVKSKLPVLLISPYLENLELILEEINRYRKTLTDNTKN